MFKVLNFRITNLWQHHQAAKLLLLPIYFNKMMEEDEEDREFMMTAFLKGLPRKVRKQKERAKRQEED